jgi:hypothetical protein
LSFNNNILNISYTISIKGIIASLILALITSYSVYILQALFRPLELSVSNCLRLINISEMRRTYLQGLLLAIFANQSLKLPLQARARAASLLRAEISHILGGITKFYLYSVLACDS